MDVGIRELKAHLSEYLDRAEAGEPIRVTHRGQAKVLIIPLPGRARLDEGVRQGWITPATSERPPGSAARERSTRRIADVLAEDRDD